MSKNQETHATSEPAPDAKTADEIRKAEKGQKHDHNANAGQHPPSHQPSQTANPTSQHAGTKAPGQGH